jgi:hypothetical protein
MRRNQRQELIDAQAPRWDIPDTRTAINPPWYPSIRDADGITKAKGILMTGQGIAQWPTHTRDVPRVSHIGDLTRPNFVSHHVSAEMPLVIENFASSDVTHLADPKVLASTYGDIRVKAMREIPQNFLLDFVKKNYSEMSLAAFVALMESTERQLPCYANQQPIERFPSLDGLLSMDALVPDLTPAFVWIGSRDANIGLHFDTSDGYLVQLHGFKRFYLIPHTQSGHVYPFADDPTRSAVDLRRLDVGKYPRLGNVVPFVGELRPGNLLFIPRYMWHYFWSTTSSVSASVFHNEEITVGRLLALLRMYGARYTFGVLTQIVRYGLLKRPFEIRGYGDPPFGYIAWHIFVDHLKAAGRRAI